MSNYCDKGHWEVGMPLPCKQCRIEELEREVERLNRIKSRTRQVELQSENDALQAHIARLRGYLERLACLGNGTRHGNSVGNVLAQEALTTTTPAQSLARLRNQVREECADFLEANRDLLYPEEAIRAMKEPE